LQLAENEYYYGSFAGQSTHLREGVKRSFLVRPVIKKIVPHYDKGTIDAEGRIHPLVLTGD